MSLSAFDVNNAKSTMAQGLLRGASSTVGWVEEEAAKSAFFDELASGLQVLQTAIEAAEQELYEIRSRVFGVPPTVTAGEGANTLKEAGYAAAAIRTVADLNVVAQRVLHMARSIGTGL